MRKIVVGLYSCKVRWHRIFSNDDRLLLLQNALRETNRRTRDLVRSGPELRGIFVAPEYLVSKSIDPDAAQVTPDLLVSDKFVEESEKDAVVKDLGHMSRFVGYGILFVPGTVAFRKSVMRPTGKTAKRTGGEKVGSRIEKTLLAFKSAPEVVRRGTTTGLEGEVALDFNANQLLMKSFATGRGISDTTLQKSYIYKNQAYVFFRGYLMHKYAKKAGYNELYGLDKDAGGYHVFAPGSRSNIKTIDDIPFGFEICRDHACGVLADGCSEAVQDRGELGPLIHVICSDSVPNVDNSPVRVGGIVLHASSNREYQVVRRKTKTGFVDWSYNKNPKDLGCEFLETVQIGGGGGSLDLFTVVVEP